MAMQGQIKETWLKNKGGTASLGKQEHGWPRNVFPHSAAVQALLAG